MRLTNPIHFFAHHLILLRTFGKECGPGSSVGIATELQAGRSGIELEIIIIIILFNFNWVVTRWQRLFYMYTKHEIGYY